MSIPGSMQAANDVRKQTRPSAARSLFLSIAMISAVILSPPAFAQDDQGRLNPNGRYCFADGSGNVNVLSGDHDGFYADPIGRTGNSLFYERVGRSNRYVSESGAFYTFFDNGRQVRWTSGSTVVVLFKC